MVLNEVVSRLIPVMPTSLKTNMAKKPKVGLKSNKNK